MATKMKRGATPRDLRGDRKPIQVAAEAGISLPTLAKIEAGGEGIAVSSLEAAAKVYGIEPWELLRACANQRAKGAA